MTTTHIGLLALLVMAQTARAQTRPDTGLRIDTLTISDSALVFKGDTTHYLHSHAVTARTTRITTDSVVLPRVVLFEPLVFGQSNVPDSVLAAGPFNATMGGLRAAEVGPAVRAAAAKHARLFILPRRADQSCTGVQGGRFCVARALAWADAVIASGFTADSVAKYVASHTIAGFNIADDYGDVDAWGGKAIIPPQIDSVARGWRARFGPAPALGVRIGYAYFGKDTASTRSLDYFWAQYRQKFDTNHVRWLAGQLAGAQTFGVKVVAAVNVYDCGPVTGGGPCQPGKVALYSKTIIANPGFCAYMGYTYNARDVAAKRAEYDGAAALVRLTPWRSCRRGA